MKALELSTMARFATEIAECDCEQQAIERMVSVVCQTIDVEHASVTLLYDRRRALACGGVTPLEANKADELQHVLAQGPQLDAADHDHVVWWTI